MKAMSNVSFNNSAKELQTSYASDKVLLQMEALIAYAESLSAKADSILHSVMNNHNFIKSSGEKEEIMEEFPNLFSNYREKLMAINAYLRHVEDCLNRCELPRN